MIWRRHDPQAHAARVHVLAPDTTCGTETCDQAYLVELVGPVEAQCAEGVIAVEDPSYNPEQWNLAGSGAYGIPQSLPADAMASAGPDWATDPDTQLRYLVGYVAGRYGDACGALAHEHAAGWY